MGPTLVLQCQCPAVDVGYASWKSRPDPAGRVAPATGEYRVPPGEEGEPEGPRHPASARKSQHNYPAKALRAVGRGVGQAEPLGPGLPTITIDR